MALKDDLITGVRKTFTTQWDTPNGEKLPTEKDIPLRNYGVLLDAVCLYADMADSTALVKNNDATFAAECYKTFLFCASKLISEHGGEVVAFDGDRVMGVFIDGGKNTNAIKTALRINWAVEDIINPELKSFYKNTNFVLRHGVGIDNGKILVTGTGVRNASDFVWVGTAANYAAKLCNLRDNVYPTWITEQVYNTCLDEARLASNGTNMWQKMVWNAQGGKTIYKSSWKWGL